MIGILWECRKWRVMKSILTLTPEESKRLIAKAVVRMEMVKKARTDGIIGLARCSTNGYIVEELIGRKLDNIMSYCSGYISGKGSCAVHSKNKTDLLVLVRGEEIWLHHTDGNILKFIDRMDCDDVIIKSGNVIDPAGQVGTLVGHPTGGEAGNYLPYILAKGIYLIVPMLISKSSPLPLSQVIQKLGTSKIRVDRSHGIVCGMIPLPGLVVTEIDALRILCNVESIPIAVNGIGSGRGSVTLLLEGDAKAIDAAWDTVNGIKGEPPLEEFPSHCDQCHVKDYPEIAARCAGRG